MMMAKMEMTKLYACRRVRVRRRALVEREKEREVHDVTYQDQACIGPTRAFMVG